MKRLGDLPFDFVRGTCETFMIDSSPTILLCFDYYEERKCRSLTRRNDGALGDVNDFSFDSEFEMDKLIIPDSKHDHYLATLAIYQGFPLILGNWDHNKLEMLCNVITYCSPYITGIKCTSEYFQDTIVS